MPRLTYRVHFTEAERELLREGTKKKLVADVLSDLAKQINGEARNTASAKLARNEKIPPTSDDLNEAVAELELRRDNLEALPQTDVRDQAIAKIGEVLDLLHATQEQVRRTDESAGVDGGAGTGGPGEHLG